MDSLTDDYLLNNISPEDPVLEWLERETNIRTTHGRMLSGPLLGRLLTTFSRMVKPQRVLEIGTFTGYSAISLARGLEGCGHLDAVEKNNLHEELIYEAFERAGVRERITLHLGDAADVLKNLAGNIYDLVYIDGNKREYCKYYELVFDLVRVGGYILADNVLWYGKVMRDPLPSDAQTKEIFRFNKMVHEDSRTESYILPVRDGLTIIRKLCK
ncbi:MAG: O-methyltransferase [Bacteroidales bacterium]|nr:O-methyltransferase [Bacteroidales bacterium]